MHPVGTFRRHGILMFYHPVRPAPADVEVLSPARDVVGHGECADGIGIVVEGHFPLGRVELGTGHVAELDELPAALVDCGRLRDRRALRHSAAHHDIRKARILFGPPKDDCGLMSSNTIFVNRRKTQ